MKVIGYFNTYNEAQAESRTLHLANFGIQNVGDLVNTKWVLVRTL